MIRGYGPYPWVTCRLQVGGRSQTGEPACWQRRPWPGAQVRSRPKSMAAMLAAQKAASSSRTSGVAGRLVIVPPSAACCRSYAMAGGRGRCCTAVLYPRSSDGQAQAGLASRGWASCRECSSPRSVRHAMHPGRAVKRAVTPKAVKQAQRAMHPVSNAIYDVERSITVNHRTPGRRPPLHARRAT